MFQLPSLIAREPRPAEQSVARRSGIVFYIGTFFDSLRKGRGLERGFKSPEILEFLSSAILLRPIGYEIRRKSCILSLKVVKAD